MFFCKSLKQEPVEMAAEYYTMKLLIWFVILVFSSSCPLHIWLSTFAKWEGATAFACSVYDNMFKVLVAWLRLYPTL